MKNIYLILLGLLFSCNLYSQKLTNTNDQNSISDSSVVVDSVETSDKWGNVKSFKYYYNKSGNITETIVYSSNNLSWRSLNTYCNIKLAQTLDQSWNGIEWLNNSKKEFSYDSTGNLREDTRSRWENNAWTEISNVTYKYDAAGNLLYDPPYSYLYDEKNNLIQKAYSYVYSVEGQIADVRISYVYDDKLNLVSALEEASFDSDSWRNNFMRTYFYNNNGSLEIEIIEHWSEEWINNGKNIYEYDLNSNLISWTFQHWEDGEWKNSQRFLYNYDSNSNKTSEFEERWTGLKWENQNRFLYSYGNKNNCINGKYAEWHDGKWMAYNNVLSFHDSFGRKFEFNNIFEFSAFYQDFSVTNILVEKNIPSDYLLNQNYPNPFNPVTSIKLSIPRASQLTLIVYNSLGEKVETLLEGFYSLGEMEVQFNAENLSSGLYYYQMKAGNNIITKKMLLLK